MKTILELLKVPLVKIIAVIVVLYFGLFHDKSNPDSLGVRLSSERIKQNLNDVEDHGRFIISNIHKVKEMSPNGVTVRQMEDENFDSLAIQDDKIGTGEELKCGDEVEISYIIRITDSASQLEEIKQEKLVIGNNIHPFIEKKIIGMKLDGVRTINIPHTYKTSDQKLKFLLKFNEANLQYKVTFLRVNPVSALNSAGCKVSAGQILNEEDNK